MPQADRSGQLLEELPMLLQHRHEVDEARIYAKAVEVRIPLETRVARETIVSGGFGPVDGLVGFLKRGVRGGDVVRSVMKMAEARAELDRPGARVRQGLRPFSSHCVQRRRHLCRA